MAVDVLPKPKLSADQILDTAQRRLAKFRDRDSFYDLLLTYYLGRDNRSISFPILASNSQGRPLLRQVGESLTSNRTYTSNRLAPIVDDYAALLGAMPSARVDDPDGSPQGQAKAEKLTKYLLSTYDFSNMDFQHALGGFYLSCFGDSVTILEPVPEDLRVGWSVISPREVYPTFWHGHRRSEVFDAVIMATLSPDDVRMQLGVTPLSDDPKDCTVINYISPYQRTIILGTQQGKTHIVRDTQWDLGFCPVIWTFNKVTGQMGMSDIKDSLSQQDLIDWGINVWADGVVYMVYPPMVVRNPMEVEGDLTVGPGETIAVQGDGGLSAVPTGANPGAIIDMINQASQDMNTASGTSQVRQQGQMHGSIQTGRAIHAAQGPQSTRIELRQQVIGRSWQRANEMTLAMQEKAPYLRDAELEIYGRMKGISFKEILKPKEDIDGWYRNSVIFDKMIGMNQQQKLQIAFEGKQAGLFDDMHGMEIIGIEDPREMRKRIEAQRMWEAETQAKMQQAAQPQQAPPGAGPQAAQGGQLPSTPPGLQPAPQIMRPAGMMSPGGGSVPGGVPMGVTRNAVAQALAKVADKLKGTVYAAGDLAMSAQATKVTLLISDYRDHSLVKQAVEPLDPGASVKAVKGGESKMPADVVRVA